MENTPNPGDDPGSGGLDRRAVLRRGAILGGALVWTVPAVQTLAGPAFAAGTACVPDSVVSVNGTCVQRTTYGDPAGGRAGQCCDCFTSVLASIPSSVGGAAVIALAICTFLEGDCTATNTPC